MDLSNILKPITEDQQKKEIIETLDKMDKRCSGDLEKKEKLIKMNYGPNILCAEEIRDFRVRFITAPKEGGEYESVKIGNNERLADLIFLRLKMLKECPECGGMSGFYKRKNLINCPKCLRTSHLETAFRSRKKLMKRDVLELAPTLNLTINIY